jgi:small-conductance mechanosensitive channel
VRQEPGRQGTSAQRWLARPSFALAGLAIVIVVVFAGLKSLAMLTVGVAAAVVTLAAGYVFLSRRGALRWLALAVFVLAPVTLAVVTAQVASSLVAQGPSRAERRPQPEPAPPEVTLAELDRRLARIEDLLTVAAPSSQPPAEAPERGAVSEGS